MVIFLPKKTSLGGSVQNCVMIFALIIPQTVAEHIGSKGILRKHFEECDIDPSENLVKIIGK